MTDVNELFVYINALWGEIEMGWDEYLWSLRMPVCVYESVWLRLAP